jgi:hypothetical protein
VVQEIVTVDRDSRIVKLCEEGLVVPKPAMDRIKGKLIYFADGTVEEIDLLVASTGMPATMTQWCISNKSV